MHTKIPIISDELFNEASEHWFSFAGISTVTLDLIAAEFTALVALNGFDDFCVKLVADIRHDAKPSLEGWACLMEKHA